MNEVVISDPPITDAIIVGSKEAVLYNFLDRYYGLRFNVITGNLENCKAKINGNAEIISDRELNTICIRIFSALEKEKISREYLNCYLNSKYLKDFNPFFDFIQQNEHLTRSQNLIQELADTIESDTPLENIRKYIKHWGCGMIASIYGSQSPLTLVLAGAKLNTGKTEFFRRLLPKELQEYYAESSLDGDKDDDILMCKKLIIMDDEFGGKSKQDQRHFKAMTSKQVMSIRLPYGKRTQEMRRICSLAGTSNDVSLLNDPYGNRRILPINVLGIDHKKYNEI